MHRDGSESFPIRPALLPHAHVITGDVQLAQAPESRNILYMCSIGIRIDWSGGHTRYFVYTSVDRMYAYAG